MDLSKQMSLKVDPWVLPTFRTRSEAAQYHCTGSAYIAKTSMLQVFGQVGRPQNRGLRCFCRYEPGHVARPI